MTAIRFVVPAIIAITLMSGCATTTTTRPAISTVTVKPKLTVTASAVWPTIPLGQAGVIGVAPSPPFPPTLVGWRLQATWNDMPRAFSGTGWTTVSGPDNADFPSTMNGCDDRRFLLRWRGVSRTAQIAARWVNSAEAVPTPDVTGTAGRVVIANAGWIEVDGCQAPQFRLVSDANGSTLTDVTVEVQQLAPAP